MIRIYCDVCKGEVVVGETIDQKFHCEVLVRTIKNVMVDKKKFMSAPRLVEGKFNLCKPCFEANLPELNK